MAARELLSGALPGSRRIAHRRLASAGSESAHLQLGPDVRRAAQQTVHLDQRASRHQETDRLSGTDRQLRTARNQGEVQASCPGSHLGDHPAARSYGHDDGRFLVFRPYSKRWAAVPAVSVRRTLAVAVLCRDVKSRHQCVDESKWPDHQDLFSARVARSGVFRCGSRGFRYCRDRLRRLAGLLQRKLRR